MPKKIKFSKDSKRKNINNKTKFIFVVKSDKYNNFKIKEKIINSKDLNLFLNKN